MPRYNQPSSILKTLKADVNRALAEITEVTNEELQALSPIAAGLARRGHKLLVVPGGRDAGHRRAFMKILPAYASLLSANEYVWSVRPTFHPDGGDVNEDEPVDDEFMDLRQPIVDAGDRLIVALEHHWIKWLTNGMGDTGPDVGIDDVRDVDDLQLWNVVSSKSWFYDDTAFSCTTSHANDSGCIYHGPRKRTIAKANAFVAGDWRSWLLAQRRRLREASVRWQKEGYRHEAPDLDGVSPTDLELLRTIEKDPQPRETLSPTLADRLIRDVLVAVEVRKRRGAKVEFLVLTGMGRAALFSATHPG